MYSFEDKLKEIEAALERKRSKWDLDALAYIDYDDIKQTIMCHIHKKWHLWNQSKPIEPWLSRVVSNQFKNLLRNHYGNYVRPCLRCKFNSGGTSCLKTISGNQDQSCAEYGNWAKKKKAAYDIKLAVTMENHTNEIYQRKDTFLDLESALGKLQKEIESEITPRQFKAFQMLFIENKTEEEVAKYLGFKTTERKRSAGYKQIKNLKKIFQEKAKQIIKQKDII
jgi:DNA-directed RNA polymerase specialized sigma24 family protein